MRTGSLPRDPHHPSTLDDMHTVSRGLQSERSEQCDGVELELPREANGAADRERQWEGLDPLRLQSGSNRTLELGPDRSLSARGPGVRHRIAVLNGDAVLLAEPPHPGRALALGLHIGVHHGLRVARTDRRELGALEERELGSAPPSGAVTYPSRLQDHHRPSRSAQKQGRCQARQARADHGDVVPTVGLA